MNGIDATSGKSLTGINHLKQSINDILTTPIGSRVMRRTYGCRAFHLIDAPMNRSTLLDFYSAIAEALDTWEPRFKLTKIEVNSAEAGKIALDLTGNYLPDGREITIDGIIIS